MAKHVSDSILLERYVSRREEAAFVDLVKRHGPRVQGTCRAPATQRTRRRRRLPGDLSRPGAQGRRDTLARIGGELAVRGRASAGDEYAGPTPRGIDAAKPHSPPWDRPAAARRPRAGFPTSTIPRPTRSSRSNAGTCARSSTTNCSICPKSTGRPLSCATSRDEPTRRPPTSSAGPRARSLAAWSGRGRSCADDSSTAASSSRPAWLGVGLAALLAHKAAQPRRSRSRDRPSAHDFAPARLERRPESSQTSPPDSLATSLPPISLQIITLARRAAQVATEIATHDPGKNRDQWRDYADEMRRSSVQLAQATQENNRWPCSRPPTGWTPVASSVTKSFVNK